MTKASLFCILFTALTYTHVHSQASFVSPDSISGEKTDKEIKGLVLSMNRKTPLPYANIYALNKNKGAITNETGHFTLTISDLKKTDTIRFQYIGYKTKMITAGQLDTTSVIYLEEDIINLSETVIFGNTPDAVSIVKNVLIYKDSNYRKTNSRKQTFIREREIADIAHFKLNYKKSNIDELDQEVIKTIEERTPEYVASYTDFLGHLYFTANKDDSVKIKIDPIRMVSLKEEYLDDLKQLETLFKGVLANTGEKEYWKIKSGVFGTKLDLEDEGEESKVDSLKESRKKITIYGWNVRRQLAYSLLYDKDQWEFLHKTGKYKYTVLGGTWVNDEEVYIIDFEPNKSGLFVGRMYISRKTFALVRADYDYAPGKTGTDFHLLGVGYTENQFSGSIYFEKKDGDYLLKYFSLRLGYEATIDRNIALFKKRKRFLFDKKLKEIKVGFELLVKMEESIEYLVLDETEISHTQFADFKQKEDMEIIYVDQFDENLWKGVSIIEPTQQMKEYKKQEDL